MAYTPLNLADIEAGKPVKEELFQTIRSNQESFNTDIEALKQTSVIDVFNIKFGGDISNYTEAEIAERIPVFKAPVDATIVSFVVTLLEASTSGTLEVEIVNWTPLLDNPVSVTTSTIGSVSGTVDWTSVAAQSFNQGDLLRIRITGIQVNQGEFHVHVYAELG
jgi:hypothetical protein